ncbi:MAG: nicotinamide mononucleotide transporter [Bacteroidales bacterium]|nr:nicotinamide mononucleotide transporter [Bacteroidales bacterium]
MEIFGVVSGLLYLYLEIRQRVWLWPVGLITSAVYIYVYLAAKFYADMGLQVYYLGISLYGWYHWRHGGRGQQQAELPVSRTPAQLRPWLAAATAGLFVLLWQLLARCTDSPVPLGDALTTALSITATWMLSRKLIEHWWIWVVVDAISVGLYLYKGLYPTVVLFLFYTAMAVVGYRQWLRTMQTHCNQPCPQSNPMP